MKKGIIIFILFLNIGMASAQLTVNQWGQVRAGHNCDSIVEGVYIYEQDRDTLSSLWVSGPDVNGNPARVIFGDAALGHYQNVHIGERYLPYNPTRNTDQLWLHGAKGIYYSIGSLYPDTVFYFDTGRGYQFTFSLPIKAPSVLVESDSRFKKNIAPLGDALSSLSQLTGVSYQLKSPRELDPSRQQRGNVSEADSKVQEEYDAFYSALDNQPEQYGFLAQEVQQVFPDLVHTDDKGYMYVDYISIIPLLVNAVNDLNVQVTDLKDENAALKSQLNNGGAVGKGISDNSSIVTTARLYQNNPNPFSSTTNIKCVLPSDVANAQILIFDLQGKLLKSYDIAERGTATITIEASELQAGMYIYTLLADGKDIDTKRMILTK